MCILSCTTAYADQAISGTAKEFLVRTGWTATGCTQRSTSTAANSDGGFANVLDDNAATYWHSDWGSCQSQNRHWLIIDMQTEQTLGGFDYIPRPNGGNGTWFVGKAYVSNSVSSLNINSATTLYNGTDEVGSFSGWANNGQTKTCTFFAPVTGRYLIIVTSSQQGGSFSSCAELKPWRMANTYEEANTVQFTPIISGSDANCQFRKSGTTIATPGWCSQFEPKDGIIGPIVVSSSATQSHANNMGLLNGQLDWRSGSALKATYTFSSNSATHYVSHIEFTATGANTIKIQFPRQAEIALSTSGVAFSADFAYGQPCYYVISGTNSQCTLTNMRVTLSPKSDAAVARGEQFTQAYDFYELWRPILGEDLYTTLNPEELYATIANPTATDDAATTLFNTKRTAAMTELAGRPIYIRNVRRSGQPYLASTSATTVNTAPTATNEAGWYIVKNDNSGSFKLYNLAQMKYLNASGGLDATGVNFTLGRNTSASPGTTLQIANSLNSGMTLDNASGNCTAGSLTDAGSSWTLTPLGLTIAQLTNGKYVRIRSARAMAKNVNNSTTYPGSIIGIQSVVDNNAAANANALVTSTCSYGLGSIWKVEAVNGEAGKFYLRNLAADFAETGENPGYYDTVNKPGYVKLPSATDKGKFNIIPAFNAGVTGSKCQRQLPTGVALLNTTNNRYMDTNGDGSNQLGYWERCDNNWPNNGGIYFLEECTDVEAIKNAYIAKSAPNFAWAQDLNTHAGNFTAYTEEITPGTAPATIGQANLYNADYKANIAPKLTDNYMHSKLATALDGTYALMKAHYVDAGARRYMSVTSDFTTAAKSANVAPDPLACIWKFEATEDGKVALRNEKSGKYIKQATANNAALPMVNDGSHSTYYVYFDNTKNVNGDGHGGFGFSGLDRGAQTDGIHFATNVCRWNLLAHPSWFDVVALDADMPISESNPNNNDITIDFGDATLCYPSDTERLITVRQTARKRPSNDPLPSWTYTSAQLAASNKVITITDGTPGTYQLEVPVAFFSRDGKYNAPITRTLQESTTGITDQMDIYPEEQLIYDLQGRRLNAPTRGINIINGRKVRL